MTRFLFLADSHFGAAPMGYMQQKGYPERVPDLLRGLRDLIAEEQIDFVLHGGDMVDATTDENILRAAECFDLPVPVYLCLGNHDLTEPDALQRWLKFAPAYFPGARPEFVVDTSDCRIHVAPNHWGSEQYWWNDSQAASFSNEQLSQLDRNLEQKSDKIHILLTHSGVWDLPGEQSGSGAPLHPPSPGFHESIADLASRHRQVRCVLGGHNHLNMRVESQGVQYVTVSAFAEVPFEVKLFEASSNGDGLRMKTLSLADRMDFRASYDFNKTHVQGRAVDRAFSVSL